MVVIQYIHIHASASLINPHTRIAQNKQTEKKTDINDNQKQQ